MSTSKMSASAALASRHGIINYDHVSLIEALKIWMGMLGDISTYAVPGRKEEVLSSVMECIKRIEKELQTYHEQNGILDRKNLALEKKLAALEKSEPKVEEKLPCSHKNQQFCHYAKGFYCPDCGRLD